MKTMTLAILTILLMSFSAFAQNSSTEAVGDTVATKLPNACNCNLTGGTVHSVQDAREDAALYNQAGPPTPAGKTKPEEASSADAPRQ